MCFAPVPPAGLRLEIDGKIDKKKNQFYFSLLNKNSLTKKEPERGERNSEKIIRC
jgi:hypothetical protein